MDREAAELEREMSAFRQALAVVKADGGARAELKIVGRE